MPSSAARCAPAHYKKREARNKAAKDVDAGDGKVVGTCDGGTKKIVSNKGTVAEAPAKAPSGL
jgi:hypothetical protein